VAVAIQLAARRLCSTRAIAPGPTPLFSRALRVIGRRRLHKTRNGVKHLWKKDQGACCLAAEHGHRWRTEDQGVRWGARDHPASGIEHSFMMKKRRQKKETISLEVLEKTQTGIQGLDEITAGGLPKGRPTLIAGSAGSGKTTIAMEFLVRGVLD
jgi:hypothetical protein